MIKSLLKIRFKQLLRVIHEIGLFRLIFLVGILGFVFFWLFKEISITPDKYIVTGIYFFFIFSLHLKRTDKKFLLISADFPYKIYFVEYFLLSIPVLFCLIFYQEWVILLPYLLGIFIISMSTLAYSPKHINLNNRLIKIIPSNSFEWKAGIRTNFILMITVWILGMFTSFFIGSVLITIFIIGIIPLGFYQNFESLTILISYEYGTKKFLWHKIKTAQIQFSLMVIPLILMFLIFHTDKWYIPVAEYILLSLVLVYSVLLKYAFYEPDKNRSVNEIFVSIGILSMFFPLMIPVTWILSIRFYFKSLSNLNQYLYDFN